MSSDVERTPAAVGGEEARPEVADLSVAIVYPGDRVEKLLRPLAASAMDIHVDPPIPIDHDAIIADNADRKLAKAMLGSRALETPLVYRMRGDVFHELELWEMHPVKERVARQVVLPHVDAVCAVTDRLARTFRAETGLETVGSAGLVKLPDEYPTVEHTDRELRAVTLTNANYWRKVRLIPKWAAVVDEWCSRHGGRWRIGARGDHADRLAAALAGYDHVHFEGYLDCHDALRWATVMLHPSELDGQPNSILEGLAAGLPVVTNTFVEFEAFGGPLTTVDTAAQLRAALDTYTDPETRARVGEDGIAYLREHHSEAAIAAEYEAFLAGVVTDG